MPVFGPLAVKKMFPEMFDIAGQMVLKWDRDGPDHKIVISDDFTISLSETPFMKAVLTRTLQNGIRYDWSLWL